MLLLNVFKSQTWVFPTKALFTDVLISAFNKTKVLHPLQLETGFSNNATAIEANCAKVEERVNALVGKFERGR